MPFNDFPSLDFGLGETADQVRGQVATFASDQVAPIAQEIDKKDAFPRELWRKMGDLGILGITVEEEFGGAGLGYLEHVVAVEELSRGFPETDQRRLQSLLTLLREWLAEHDQTFIPVR